MSQKSCEDIVNSIHADRRLSKLLQLESQPIVSCRPCSQNGIEGGARAVLIDSTPLHIVLCTNRLRSDEISEALIHESVHAYDHALKRYDFSTCEGLACTEVRAAREAECNRFFPIDWLKQQCVRYHAVRSTRNLFPNEALKCVDKVQSEAMKDLTPFESLKDN